VVSDTGIINLLLGGAGTDANDLSVGDPANAKDVILNVATASAKIFLSYGSVASPNSVTAIVQGNNIGGTATKVSVPGGTVNRTTNVPPLP
jgi:hypothetical protein